MVDLFDIRNSFSDGWIDQILCSGIESAESRLEVILFFFVVFFSSFSAPFPVDLVDIHI